MQQSLQEYHRNISEVEKIKKRNYSNNRNKYMSDEDRERKRISFMVHMI